MGIVEDRLRKWSERTGIPLKDLREMYESLVDEIGSKTKALRELRIRLSEEIGSLRSPATPYYALIMGDTGVYDYVESIRSRVERSDRFRERAISIGLINEDGDPLDRDGNILTGPIYRRDLFVAISKDESFAEPRLAWITLYDERDQSEEYRQGAFYKIRCNGSLSRQLPRLTKGRGTFVREVSLDVSVEDVSSALGCMPLTVGTIESLLSTNRKPPVVTFKGIAKYLSLDPRNGHRGFRLYSNEDEIDLPDLYVYCRVPAATMITFRELDEVHVFGSIWKGRRSDKDYNMDVYGYIALPFKEVV